MMPAYNVQPYIGAAIETVQAQTYKNWELIICDDGSEDDTLAIAVDYMTRDKRVRVVASEHKGCPATRNKCLKYMTGDIFARQDADDLMDPTRIERQLDQLQSAKADLCTTEYCQLRGDKLTTLKVGGMDPEAYRSGTANGPCCASIIAKAEVYRVVGPFVETQLGGSDCDWNFRVLEHDYRWTHVPECLYIQRRHDDQVSKRFSRQQQSVRKDWVRKYS
jgi:glycosyltransferase involved in cell wall biosynthesis